MCPATGAVLRGLAEPLRILREMWGVDAGGNIQRLLRWGHGRVNKSRACDRNQIELPVLKSVVGVFIAADIFTFPPE
jgi:hypothetical protein